MRSSIARHRPHRRLLVLGYQLHGGRGLDRRPDTRPDLYFLDWDSTGRSEQVQISNADGAVLDTETVSSFNAGSTWSGRSAAT